VTKYLLGVFDRDADPEEIVAAAREALARLGIEPPTASDDSSQDESAGRE
jgi:hypothetical protein